jgi:superfamily II DNA/RNA helicase
MKAVEGKNFITDLQSKKFTWKDLGLPEWLIPNLTDHPLKYEIPSIIQAQAIPLIINERG